MREIIIVSILCMFCMDCFAQSISITEISPGAQTTLGFGNQVEISFDYEINTPEGARIFIRPFTSGSLTPNYSASGSTVYRGSGSGSANFTIQSGRATVDQIRVRSLSLQNELLFEFFIPVKLSFVPQISTEYQNRMLAITESRAARAAVQAEDMQSEVASASDSISLADCPDSNENEVVERKMKPDGTLEMHYSDGTIVGILSAASSSGMNSYSIDPETRDTTFTRYSFFIEVQEANPPGFVGSEAAVNEDWLQSLNGWIEHHGNRLLSRIDMLLDDEAYEAYLTYEENSDLSIYERVNFRYTFLERLAE